MELIDNIKYKILEAVSKIQRFFYYGKAGMNCVEYCATGVYTLEHAHMKRVTKFMLSDKTHLVWNDSVKTNLMRKLQEFTVLCEYMDETHEEMRHFSKLLDETEQFKVGVFRRNYPTVELEKYYKFKFKKAIEKDREFYKNRQERYNHLRTYLRHWWD